MEATRPTIGAAANAPPHAVDAGALEALAAAVDRIACGYPGEALSALEALCAAYPGWAVARAYLGTAYLGLARVAEARDELELAVGLAPESFICRLRHAEFLARMGFFDLAAVELDAALHVPAPDIGARDAALSLRAFCRQKARGLFYRETPDLRSRLQPWLARFTRRRAGLAAPFVER